MGKIVTTEYNTSPYIKVKCQKIQGFRFVDVFPINSEIPYRLEFFSQTLESISPLEKLELEKTDETRKRFLNKRWRN